MTTKICKKCGHSFPLRAKIDGRWKNFQRRSYCLDCFPIGTRPGKKTNQTFDYSEGGANCISCNEVKPLSCFYFSRKTKSGIRYPRLECKTCLSASFKERWIQIKNDAINLFGNKCEDCKQSFPRQVYDFHHLDESTKLYDWRDMRQISKEKREAELKKCVMLCANCHRIRHSAQEI